MASRNSFPSENRTRFLTSWSQYDVRIADEKDSWIVGCCMLPNDEILLLDSWNRNLKKLDADYRVTSTCKLRDGVSSTVTYIGNSEAVVCAVFALVYVNVSGNMRVKKTVKLDTYCNDVTCSNNRLYVLYNTSIQICTLEDDTVSVIPLEQRDDLNWRIAVAEDGRIYVTSLMNRLISLDSLGKVINTPPDVDRGPVCVDDRGNVWAAGYNNVYHISSDGSQIRNTLPVNIVGVRESLCYDKRSSSLILGGYNKTITVIGLN